MLDENDLAVLNAAFAANPRIVANFVLFLENSGIELEVSE